MDTRSTTYPRNPAVVHQTGTIDVDNGGRKQDGEGSSNPSSARCCCLLVLILLFLLLLLSAVVAFLLKPKKPFFSLHSIQIDPLHLNVSSSSKQVYVPASTATLSFLTGNPNKYYGIVYSSSALDVATSDGTAVGVIRVPEFYQPPRGRNVTLPMRFSFGRLDLVQLTHGGLLNGSYAGPRVVEARIAGRVRAGLHVLNFTLPKIKVAVNCRVSVDYGAIAFSKAMEALRTRKAIQLSSYPHLSHNCSLALRL